jgi:Glucuronate isomerase
MPFVHPEFLLTTSIARRLFHEVAGPLPIIDYHCHLPPREVAEDRRFSNLTEIWLEGDHYKWRALRTNGIEERLITGDADPKEKFLAWARTTPMTLRNPLYHWTHLELARYFDIHDLLDEESAESIWERANAKLAEPEFSARGILEKFKVEVVGTTDDPTDTLEWHAMCRDLPTKVLPTFRPDRACAIDTGDEWNAWVDLLAERSGMSIETSDDFFAALEKRHDFFHEMGGRLSDHGTGRFPFASATDGEIATIFREARAGATISPEQAEKFATRVLLETGRWNAARGWTMQLHVGALRNNRSAILRTIGRDAGCDSIGSWSHAEQISRFLDALDSEGRLPRTILYNLNPADNYVFATMIGNFQDGSIPGKVQFGSGWWFLDQRQGIEWQLDALSNCGLLSRFVGMITDSRSFLSYPRHEYFRRVLCELIGRDVACGSLPDDFRMLARLVEGVCYGNARKFFGIFPN